MFSRLLIDDESSQGSIRSIPKPHLSFGEDEANTPDRSRVSLVRTQGCCHRETADRPYGRSESPQSAKFIYESLKPKSMNLKPPPCIQIIPIPISDIIHTSSGSSGSSLRLHIQSGSKNPKGLQEKVCREGPKSTQISEDKSSGFSSHSGPCVNSNRSLEFQRPCLNLNSKGSPNHNREAKSNLNTISVDPSSHEKRFLERIYLVGPENDTAIQRIYEERGVRSPSADQKLTGKLLVQGSLRGTPNFGGNLPKPGSCFTNWVDWQAACLLENKHNHKKQGSHEANQNSPSKNPVNLPYQSISVGLNPFRKQSEQESNS
jgi:hypothetical protein